MIVFTSSREAPSAFRTSADTTPVDHVDQFARSIKSMTNHRPLAIFTYRSAIDFEIAFLAVIYDCCPCRIQSWLQKLSTASSSTSGLYRCKLLAWSSCVWMCYSQ